VEVTQSGRDNTICQVPFAVRGVRRSRHRNEQSEYWHANAKQVIVQTRSERTAEEWCQNSDATSEMEARPEGNGFDLSAINAEFFLQARESFGLFDELMKSAQHRRISLLREIAARRELEYEISELA
jgi:hypothetical protein